MYYILLLLLLVVVVVVIATPNTTHAIRPTDWRSRPAALYIPPTHARGTGTGTDQSRVVLEPRLLSPTNRIHASTGKQAGPAFKADSCRYYCLFKTQAVLSLRKTINKYTPLYVYIYMYTCIELYLLQYSAVSRRSVHTPLPHCTLYIILYMQYTCFIEFIVTLTPNYLSVHHTLR